MNLRAGSSQLHLKDIRAINKTSLDPSILLSECSLPINLGMEVDYSLMGHYAPV